MILKPVTLKKCAKCGNPLHCQHETDCWCEQHSLSPGKAYKLVTEHSDCLCPDCLKEYVLE